MLTAVQKKFSYTLRNLIDSHLGYLKSENPTESTASIATEYVTDFNEETTTSSTQLPITTINEYNRWFDSSEESTSTTGYYFDDEEYIYKTSASSREFTTLSPYTTVEPEESNDNTEEYGSSSTNDSATNNETASSTDNTTDKTTDDSTDSYTESITTEEPQNSTEPKKVNSFSELWGADLDELDEILNNRLKKSYEYVTPDSLVTRRDVSYLDGRQFIQAARHTYLPPISLRPPIQPSTQSLNYYQV